MTQMGKVHQYFAVFPKNDFNNHRLAKTVWATVRLSVSQKHVHMIIMCTFFVKIAVLKRKN